jgi:Zn-finger nucleic acid-binding protein
MNCSNCGAPLKPIAGRDYSYCEFCDTFCFAASLEDSPDGVTFLGEAGGVVCPACESPLSKGGIKGSQILFCENCRGILVDSENFAEVVRRRRADRSGPPDEPRPLDPADLKRHIDCPLCGRPMEVHPYYGPGNAVIDSCARCRMVWLDHGELAAIVQAPGR